MATGYQSLSPRTPKSTGMSASTSLDRVKPCQRAWSAARGLMRVCCTKELALMFAANVDEGVVESRLPTCGPRRRR
jgi:hypothetical protein